MRERDPRDEGERKSRARLHRAKLPLESGEMPLKHFKELHVTESYLVL